MNKLIRHRIKVFQKKYIDSSFDQDDVYILMMDLRELCTKDELHIREVGDYLAHPQRDKGLTFSELQKVYKQIVPKFRELWARTHGLPKLPIIFKEVVLFAEIDGIFERIGLPLLEVKNYFNDQRAIDFSLCILSLLCDAKIRIGDSFCNLHLALVLGTRPRNLALYADIKIRVGGKVMTLHWPIFQSSCLVHPDCVTQVPPYGKNKHIVARRRDDGKMAIYSLETDLNNA